MRSRRPDGGIDGAQRNRPVRVALQPLLDGHAVRVLTEPDDDEEGEFFELAEMLVLHRIRILSFGEHITVRETWRPSRRAGAGLPRLRSSNRCWWRKPVPRNPPPVVLAAGRRRFNTRLPQEDPCPHSNRRSA